MAYNPTEWKDEVVQHPRRIRLTPVMGESDVYDYDREKGTITEEGTPVTAANLNNVEQGLETHLADIATEEQLGHIKVGENLTIDGDGTLNAQGGVDYNITDVDPTAEDDTTKGYEVGSRWINEADEMEYICVSNAENEAVWRGTTENRRAGFTIVGLEWNQGTDSYQRLDDAENLTVGASVGGQAIQSDFDNIFPYSEMKRCNLSDAGVVNAYYGDPLYIEDGSNGQVMVEIPKFWYKSEKVDSIYRWWIANTETIGYNVHPAFIRNGVEKDKIYISAYEGNVSSNIMRSIANAKPSTDENVSDGTIGGFRGYAQARGTNWEMQDFLTTSAIQLLYLIEFATFDTQTTIGRGVVDKTSGSGNESNNTGATSFLGNASGRQSGTDGLTSISCRGIENFWGNIWKFIDGLNLSDYEAFIADHDFESDKFTDNYSSVGSVLSTSDTFIKDIVFNGLDFGFLASEGGGSSSTYLHDNWWVNTGQRVGRFGGNWTIDSRAGGFCWYLHADSATATRDYGARLAFYG